MELELLGDGHREDRQPEGFGTMSDINLARQRIEQIAGELRRAGQQEIATRLTNVIPLMRRRRAARRMRTHSNTVTPQIIAQVRHLARTTDLHSSEIAAQLGINPGRVSEILQGDR
jgi:hypothetical protein